MNRGVSAIFAVLAVFVLLAGPRLYGQGATASIVGQVTDESGAVLPGVTVTVTSPALQVPQMIAVSDQQGEYRISPLPIGRYIVEYSLQGFSTLRQEDVQLTTGFVAKLDRTMKVATVAETIVVSGTAPLVDVVSTVVRTTVTADAVELIPTSRNGLNAYLQQAPGVRENFSIGPDGGQTGANFRAYGQTGEAWDMLEGVMMARSTGGSSSGSILEYASIEQTRIQTVSSNAEMPRRGVLADVIVKSGSNQFHGEIAERQLSSRFQSNNVDDALKSKGIRSGGKLHRQYDINGNVGGRVVENKLWFYFGTRRQVYDRELLNAYDPSGKPIVGGFSQEFHVEKLSYQVTPGNRLIGFNHWGGDRELRGASQFRPAENMETYTSKRPISKAEWQIIRGKSLVMSFQHGRNRVLALNDALPTTNKPTTFDMATLNYTGITPNGGARNSWLRHHSKGTLSWYRPDRLGNHEVKLGFDNMYANVDNFNVSRPQGDYILMLNNGAPSQIQTSNAPTKPKNRGLFLGIYGQDTWTLGRRVTLDGGVRWDRNNGYTPAQCREAGQFVAAACFARVQLPIFSAIAPRLHMAWDILGDGKMALKGGYGRFNHEREIVPEISDFNANNFATTTWRWRDLNNNVNYDPGEVNFDPGGADFLSTTGGVAVAIVNPNEKQPKGDEYSVFLERELMANWAVRAGAVYAHNVNTYRALTPGRPYEAYSIPITNRDPGIDGNLGTADDPGTSITYYDFPVQYRGAAFDKIMRVNDPNADQTYRTFEIATNKRLTGGWQFTGSYSATKLHIPFGTSTPALAFTPNAEIFTSNDTWEWIGKVAGTYTLPRAILLSANFESRSGAVGARQVLFRGGSQIPTIVLNVEPIGSRQLPSTNVLDISAAKRLSFKHGQALQLRVEMFNALNINTPTAWTLRAGPNFLVPTAIVNPRLGQINVSYTF